MIVNGSLKLGGTFFEKRNLVIFQLLSDRPFEHGKGSPVDKPACKILQPTSFRWCCERKRLFVFCFRKNLFQGLLAYIEWNLSFSMWGGGRKGEC